MVCPNCGAKLMEGDQFCVECGTKIVVPAQTASPQQNVRMQQTMPIRSDVARKQSAVRIIKVILAIVTAIVDIYFYSYNKDLYDWSFRTPYLSMTQGEYQFVIVALSIILFFDIVQAIIKKSIIPAAIIIVFGVIIALMSDINYIWLAVLGGAELVLAIISTRLARKER